MQDIDDDLYLSVRCSQASTQELSQIFPSQESQNFEEPENAIPKVKSHKMLDEKISSIKDILHQQ